jgi:hypothetical protein
LRAWARLPQGIAGALDVLLPAVDELVQLPHQRLYLGRDLFRQPGNLAGGEALDIGPHAIDPPEAPTQKPALHEEEQHAREQRQGRAGPEQPPQRLQDGIQVLGDGDGEGLSVLLVAGLPHKQPLPLGALLLVQFGFPGRQGEHRQGLVPEGAGAEQRPVLEPDDEIMAGEGLAEDRGHRPRDLPWRRGEASDDGVRVVGETGGDELLRCLPADPDGCTRDGDEQGHHQQTQGPLKGALKGASASALEWVPLWGLPEGRDTFCLSHLRLKGGFRRPGGSLAGGASSLRRVCVQRTPLPSAARPRWSVTRERRIPDHGGSRSDPARSSPAACAHRPR